jgi:hypothetical protein
LTYKERLRIYPKVALAVMTTRPWRMWKAHITEPNGMEVAAAELALMQQEAISVKKARSLARVGRMVAERRYISLAA